jgi:hypothetical protein
MPSELPPEGNDKQSEAILTVDPLNIKPQLLTTVPAKYSFLTTSNRDANSGQPVTSVTQSTARQG